jgi:glycosyltransferase involved in cell wall biosynthesis
MNQPKVSIITPSYNQGQFIEETILSVLNQSYKNIEYILVDGGSTDDTMKVVEKYRGRIDIVIHEKDKGQSDAINKGFKLATGELVGWINSDDILYTDCVEKIVDMYRRNNDGSIYYSSKIHWIDEHGELIEERERKIINREDLLNNDYDVIQQGSFYKTEVVKKVGFLNETLNFCMDLDLWLKLLNFGKIYSFDEKALAGFRMWEGTKTTTGEIKFLKDIKKTLELHGMTSTSKNNKRLQWYMLKKRVKALIKG